jgi:hypothetical protein
MHMAQQTHFMSAAHASYCEQQLVFAHLTHAVSVEFGGHIGPPVDELAPVMKAPVDVPVPVVAVVIPPPHAAWQAPNAHWPIAWVGWSVKLHMPAQAMGFPWFASRQAKHVAQVGSEAQAITWEQQLILVHEAHAVSPGAGMQVTLEPVLVPVPVCGPPVLVPVWGPPVLVPFPPVPVPGPPVDVLTVLTTVPDVVVPAPPCDVDFVTVLLHDAATTTSPTNEARPNPSSRVPMNPPSSGAPGAAKDSASYRNLGRPGTVAPLLQCFLR